MNAVTAKFPFSHIMGLLGRRAGNLTGAQFTYSPRKELYSCHVNSGKREPAI